MGPSPGEPPPKAGGGTQRKATPAQQKKTEDLEDAKFAKIIKDWPKKSSGKSLELATKCLEEYNLWNGGPKTRTMIDVFGNQQEYDEDEGEVLPSNIEQVALALERLANTAKDPGRVERTQGILRLLAKVLMAEQERLQKAADVETVVREGKKAQEEATKTITNMVKETLQKGMEEMAGKVKEMVREEVSKGRGTMTLGASGLSYRDMLAQGIGPAGGVNHRTAAAMQRAQASQEVKERQVVVDMREGAVLGDDDGAAILDKANDALENIHNVGEARFESVKRLKNGGLLFEADGEELVKDLQRKDIREAFLEKFCEGAFIKDREHGLIAYAVPITIEPTNEEHLREIEEHNGLENGAIVKARWIKPIYRRSPTQRFANLAIYTIKAETAARMIATGLGIAHKSVACEMLKREPIRCLACQKYGHVVAGCTEKGTNVCSTCGGDHRSDSCTNLDKRWCVSCQSKEHASWDRQCPVFIRKSNEMNARDPLMGILQGMGGYGGAGEMGTRERQAPKNVEEAGKKAGSGGGELSGKNTQTRLTQQGATKQLAFSQGSVQKRRTTPPPADD